MSGRQTKTLFSCACLSINPITHNPIPNARQEAKTGTAAAEAAEVKLYCQVPAITKLDSSLGTLANCEYVIACRAWWPTTNQVIESNPIMHHPILIIPSQVALALDQPDRPHGLAGRYAQAPHPVPGPEPDQEGAMMMMV